MAHRPVALSEEQYVGDQRGVVLMLITESCLYFVSRGTSDLDFWRRQRLLNINPLALHRCADRVSNTLKARARVRQRVLDRRGLCRFATSHAPRDAPSR